MDLYLSPSLANVLRNHELRLDRLDSYPVGCENSDDCFIVVDVMPEDPQCGCCYVLIGETICTENCDAPECGPGEMWDPITESCVDDPDGGDGGGGGEEDCRGCAGEMGGEWDNTGLEMTFIPNAVMASV